MARLEQGTGEIQQSWLIYPAAGKLAGLDKKLSKSLDQDVQLGSSPLELSKSPVGPLAESSRHCFICLHLSVSSSLAFSLFSA